MTSTLLLWSCGGTPPPRGESLTVDEPRLMFDASPVDATSLRVDLQAFDHGPLRFELRGRTITPKVVRQPLPDGVLVRGSFGDHGTLVFARVGETVTGVVRDRDGGFEIVPVRGGHRRVPRTWDLRSAHGPGWSEVSARRGVRPPPRMSTEPVVIDVLFAYTADVLANRSLDSIRALVHAAMADLETACDAAAANVRFQVAGIVPTTGSEVAKDGTRKDLYTVFRELVDRRDFTDAHATRKTLHADILVLLVDTVDGGHGMATIMGTPETAVAVVEHHDSLWYLTIPHEIGHIMGALHDDDTRADPFPYGHGYATSAGRTIMANPCAGCPLEVRWSHKPLGDDLRRDNARVIRETAEAVSTFGDRLP